MKALALLLATTAATPVFAASSYKQLKAAGYSRGASPSYQVSAFTPSHFGGFASRSSLATSGGLTTPPPAPTTTTPAPAPAPEVPGWLAHPTPGALIRTAGMGFKTEDAGPVRNSSDYTTAGWADVIAHVAAYAQYTTGIGVRQGPPDTPPYPGGGGKGGAGGNGIFTNGPVLGLDGNGNTVVSQQSQGR